MATLLCHEPPSIESYGPAHSIRRVQPGSCLPNTCAQHHATSYYIERITIPVLVRETASRRCMAATRGVRLHAHGPWTGGDGPAADRPLSQLPQPLLLSPHSTAICNTIAAMSMWTPMKSALRSERMKAPPLADVVRVDGRRAPSARTQKRSASVICTSCADCLGSRGSPRCECGCMRDVRGSARRVCVRR